MKSNKFLKTGLLVMVLFSFAGCISGGVSPGNTPGVSGLANGETLPPISGSNVMTFTVNGSECTVHSNTYYNKPCVSVTICNPGSTIACYTIKDLLLDTGSYGLRVFKSAIPNLTLDQVTSRQGGSLAECVKFGDGTSLWGPVQTASVTMGGEPAITIPIQVIDPTFGTIPTTCGTPEATVDAAGFNGILGVGLLTNDCGSACTGTHTGNGRYFTCSGSTCVGGTSNTEAEQTQNPVSSLPIDNNGAILELPTISTSGVGSVSGYLIFGIGTESNNTPSASVLRYSTDTDGYFTTEFNGQTYDSLLDSGSNGLFFNPASSSPVCSGGSSWLCPASILTYSAVNTGQTISGVTTNVGTVNFQIGNTATFFSSSDLVFNDLGGDDNSMFDFGLPFYFGRNVYIGIEGQSSSQFGTGPYWAY
jgi:hypothetical protein